MYKWYVEIDRDNECWKIISKESQDHDGDGALTHIADVYDPQDAASIVELHNRTLKSINRNKFNEPRSPYDLSRRDDR